MEGWQDLRVAFPVECRRGARRCRRLPLRSPHAPSCARHVAPVPDGLLDALSLVRFERYYDVAGNYAGATFNCKRYLKAKALNR